MVVNTTSPSSCQWLPSSCYQPRLILAELCRGPCPRLRPTDSRGCGQSSTTFRGATIDRKHENRLLATASDTKVYF